MHVAIRDTSSHIHPHMVNRADEEVRPLLERHRARAERLLNGLRALVLLLIYETTNPAGIVRRKKSKSQAEA